MTQLKIQSNKVSVEKDKSLLFIPPITQYFSCVMINYKTMRLHIIRNVCLEVTGDSSNGQKPDRNKNG